LVDWLVGWRAIKLVGCKIGQIYTSTLVDFSNSFFTHVILFLCESSRWNWGFPQWSMSWQFAMLAGRNNSFNSGVAAQWWTVKRSLEIFKIFDEVFGDSARERVVRVLPTQSGNGEVTDGLEQVRELCVALPPLTLTIHYHPSLLASLLAFP
jgi:hypothetical protein